MNFKSFHHQINAQQKYFSMCLPCHLNFHYTWPFSTFLLFNDNSNLTIDRRLYRSTIWQQVQKKCKIALMRNPYWSFWSQPSWKFALCREEQSHQHCWFTIWWHRALKKNYKRNAKLRWWEIHIGRFGTNPFKITHGAEETVGDCGRWNKSRCEWKKM